MSSVNMQRQRLCEQDHTNVSVEFHIAGPATEKARRPQDSVCTNSWWLAAERRCCLNAVAETRTQCTTRYWGAVSL